MKFIGEGIELCFPNGRSGDPCVYAFNHRTGEAFLFDLGSLDRMPVKRLLKIRKVFVTHTHIDHFIGFDRLLRVNVPHHRQLEICGASGIVSNIRGKLAGYTWNLLVKGQLCFLLHEISPKQISTYRLSFEDGFKLELQSDFAHEEGVITHFADGSVIKSTLVEHGIPVATYRFSLPKRYQVRSDVLQKHGFKSGVWLKNLQKMVSAGREAEEIEVNGKSMSVAWLKDELLVTKPPFSISYLTDLQFSWHNLQRVKALHSNTSVLFCESAFKEQDYERAKQKSHLTTKQCAMLGAYTNATRLENFHFSNIYGVDKKQLLTETNRYFAKYKRLSADVLEREISAEINR